MIEFVIAIGLLALLIVGFLIVKVVKKSQGNEKMREIASAIHLGAMTYLKTQYKILAIFVVIGFIFIALTLNYQTAVSFLAGAILSGLAGFIGMEIATKANVRTTEAAKSSMQNAFKIAFNAGSVMGLSVVALGLLGLTILYLLFKEPIYLIGFSLGASSIGLFARVGGGIYTKAADVGADLVGKVEEGIPEDDPRNPAVIADNVGDNVGDVAGMGADLFGSYVDTIVASMIIGILVHGVTGILFPLVLAAVGILCSIVTIFLVRGHPSRPIKSLRNALLGSTAIALVAEFFVVRYFFPGDLSLFYAVASGLVAGLAMGFITEYYTSEERKHVHKIAQASTTGAATNIIQGLATGMRSTGLPIGVLVLVIYIAFTFGGIYGIAIAGLSMLATLGVSLAIDTYGPVADNAGGIAEMSGLDKSVRAVTDKLDAAGNTTAAIGKGFAIGNAALVALAMFSTYATDAQLGAIDILNFKVLIGLFLGAMLTFLFSSFTMQSVGNAAMGIIEEVRRQFKTIPGLREGKAKPDYAKCVDISTKSALKEMIVPGLMVLLSPIAVGIILGPLALAGLLAGAIVTGSLLGLMMANTGGAWDNAKKYIEAGHHGGKGSPTHKAAVVGDTVGDPFKDTSGPSLNILIKLMAIVALTFLPFFI